MNSDAEWKSFSLTHVEYISGDKVGHLLAICSLLPIFVIVGFITLILFRRDLHTISFFVGMLLNEGINLILKSIIGQPRPYVRENLYTDNGMPSSHAQFSWFFAVYCVLFIVFRLKHKPNSVQEATWKTIVATGLIIAACLVTYSRVYLLYHSWSQVVCGMFIGTLLGGLWFTVVHYFFTSYFPAISSWWICEQLLVRDTSLIPNVLWFEYTSSRLENRARHRKNSYMKTH